MIDLRVDGVLGVAAALPLFGWKERVNLQQHSMYTVHVSVYTYIRVYVYMYIIHV